MNTAEETNRLKEWQQKAMDAAKTAGSTTDRYVRENTWIAIGVAALLGCVVGYMLASGNHED